MKGHVAPENLNDGLNNEMPASIVFDRHPSYLLPLGYGMLQYSSPSRDEASGSDKTAVTQLQGAPLHLVTGAPLPPPCLSVPHFWLGWMQECLVSPWQKSIVSVHSPMVCVRVCVCVRACELIVQLSLCVLQQDSA